MILAHRIALDPTPQQANFMARACGVSRFTWNWALAEWNRQYEAGEKPNGLFLKKQWNAVKHQQFPWVAESPKGANQRPFDDLQKAFVKFFKKGAQRPRFKKKGRRDSFYVENDKFRLDGKKVTLPKIGAVKTREPLCFTGKIMGGVVSRVANRWFLSVQVDVTSYKKPRTGSGSVGVDLGLKTTAVTSDGEQFNAPKPLKRLLKKLRRSSQSVSRKQPGSNRRYKARLRLSRLHARIANVRKDFLHKLTTHLCRENQTVVIEDLNVSGMLQNERLARAISDVGLREFRRQLEYKQLIFDTELIVADRWFPSSKRCSRCGHVKSELPLSERTFTCDACGLCLDRDQNAAINLNNYPRLEGKSRSWTAPVAGQDEARTGTCSLVGT